MATKNIISSLVLLLLTLCLSVACTQKSDKKEDNYSNRRAAMEVEAQNRLATARQKLKEGNLVAAKNAIEKMRTDCYLALTARQQGILLMDSVELKMAQDELTKADVQLKNNASQANNDAFTEACRKVQFYERKLQFDKQRK